MPKTDRHSRIVNGLKVGLPLAALALLSTLFLLADRVDPEAAVTYAKVDVRDLLKDPRMNAPTYAGTTDDGVAVSVTATAARPANKTRMASADEVTAQLKMPDGGTVDIVAKAADINTVQDQLRLSNGVHIKTSSGYDITMPDLVGALDRSEAHSNGPIDGFAPAGHLQAGTFSLKKNPDETMPSSYVLVFSDRVKLIYDPKGR